VRLTARRSLFPGSFVSPRSGFFRSIEYPVLTDAVIFWSEFGFFDCLPIPTGLAPGILRSVSVGNLSMAGMAPALAVAFLFIHMG
jgi:hypothetical protein